MKILLLVGLLVIVLGIASLIVPIPRTENHGIKAGDVNIGVQTSSSERVVTNRQCGADRRRDCAGHCRFAYRNVEKLTRVVNS